MNILIIDDNIEKVKKVISQLMTLDGITRENISSVGSSSDARRLLSDNTYDLMILDLSLPYYIESDESIDVSMQLLEDIKNSGELIPPLQIVGLSAFKELVQEHEIFFNENLWTLFHYIDNSDGWVKEILNCVRYLLQNENNKEDDIPRVDVCILTALYDPELTAILELDWDWGDPTPLDNTTFMRKGCLTIDGSKYSVVAVSGSRMGMVTSSILSSKLIHICRPKILIMSGICAGIKGKVNLGDPILATTCWDYQSGKRAIDKDESKFFIAPHQIHVPEFIETRYVEMSHNKLLLSKIKSKWKISNIDHELRLHSGSMASGSAVLADENIVKDVIQQDRTLKGIEMEVYGVYSSALSASNIKPITFAIKSVCDFADQQKHDDFQKYAAFTSAQVIGEFLNLYIKDILKIS
jgi:nucleoside phosphorylase